MLWWLAQKCCAVADQRPDDVDLQVLATCTWGLQRCTEIQSNAGIILTEAEANEASSCLFTYNKCFAWLALRFKGDGYLFKVRPKGHYLEHMAFALKELRLNQVKLFATHSEESFLGKVKSIACRVHGKTLSKRVFERYILCLAVSMHRLKNRYAKNWTTKKGVKKPASTGISQCSKPLQGKAFEFQGKQVLFLKQMFNIHHLILCYIL